MDLLKLPPGESDPAAVLAARLQQPRTLVHIENADSAAAAAPLAPLVARLAGCALVISGRFQGLGDAAGWAQLRLQTFDEATALDQLRQELGGTLPVGAGDLVRALGYLPLAIHLAAGHLRTGRSVAGFLGLLQAQRLAVVHPDPADPTSQADRERAVLSTTFNLSLGLLQEQLGAAAATLLPAFQALGHAPTAGSRYAMRNGPFGAWLAFCERALQVEQPDEAKSNLLWTLCNVARSGGQLERALTAARQKVELDQGRGEEREAALPLGALADVLQARGQLDEALRIRREEQLPVFERLGATRDMLVCRANIGLNYLARGSAADRQQALEYLHRALADAQRLCIPEAQQIEAIIQQAGGAPRPAAGRGGWRAAILLDLPRHLADRPGAADDHGPNCATIQRERRATER